MIFHEYLENLRISKELGMRELAHKIGMDVGNYSRLERGITSPPNKDEFYNKVSDNLNLGEDESLKLRELAELSKGKIPKDIVNEVKQYEYLPVLLRTIANKQLTDEQLKELTERINKEE